MSSSESSELLLTQGYQEIQDAVADCKTEEGWSATGKSVCNKILTRLLDDCLGNAGALPLIHALLYLLLKESCPSSESLASFISEFKDNDRIGVFQEAVIDVVTAVVEQDNLRKEELARLEGGDAAIDKQNAQCPRPLAVLRSLMSSGFVTPERAAYILPSSLLTDPFLTLLPPNSNAQKHAAAERRKRTATYYKQKKYNLSREASEGYTSIMVLLDDERFLKQGGDEEDPVDRQSRAKALWRECLAIIGWYDLSPQRIVDLLLDAFCQRIATHWRFYLDVLEVSPWAKRNTTPSGTTADEPEDGSGPLADIDTEVNIPSTVTTEFMSQVNSETGNKILTQTLGFKFAFHQYHNGDLKGVEEDPTDAPKELLYMTAILIRQGFIRTLDILPYLSLDDAGMDGLLRAYKTKTQQDIRNLGGNALLMAAALPDDDAPKGSNSVDAETEASKPRKDLAIQKIQLCEALLAIGHLQPAFYIISRWPVIAQYSEQVALLIMRIVEYALQPACDALEVLQNADIPTLSQNYRTHFQFSDPEQIATLYCPEPLDTEKQQYKFFFKEWSTKLERWASPEEVVAKAQPFMRIVGARAAANVNVLISLCRIGVYHMTIDASEQNKQAWINMIRTALLPAMPLLPAHYGYNVELWPLIKPLPYEFRYSLYGEWHIAMTETKDRSYIPAMGLAAAAVQNTTKQTLKRMTSDLNRAHARAIGKGSYSAPTALWQAILPQIMSYENMIDTVVESARYLSDLGWDVTMFMLLDALSDESKERVKSDGLTASAWLQAVSSFIGRLAKRYTAMPLEPLVQQIANQLKKQSLADLITLKQLISKMSGIEIAQDQTKAQVACLAGGPLMQVEAIDLTQIHFPPPPMDENERTTRGRPKKAMVYENSRTRLLQALQNSNLTFPLLISIAQAREACVFVATENLGHTKQLGLAFDDCHNVLTQYLHLLQVGLSSDQIATMMPTFRQLHENFGLSWGSTYHIIRPQLYRSIYNDREAYLRLRLGWKNRVASADEAAMVTWNEETIQSPLLPLVLDTARCVSVEVRANRLEPFIASFWQMALPELRVPGEAYKLAVARFESSILKLDGWLLNRNLTSDWIEAYRSNKAELSSLSAKLKIEEELQKKVVETAASRVSSEKSTWFSDKPAIKEKRQLASLLHVTCFYPRAIYSTADALFVARFGRYLHDNRTPNFSLLLFYEEFFPDSFVPFIFSCSEREVANLGRCLSTMLGDLEPWHMSKELYEKEALGADPDNDYDGLLHGMKLDAPRYLDWEMFRNMCYKWHRRLAKAISLCLESSDYLHIKNGLTLAQRLIPVFPKVDRLYNEVVKSLENFRKREKAREDPREDLLLVVQAYTSLLEGGKRDKSIALIPVGQYCKPPGSTARVKPGSLPSANDQLLKTTVTLAAEDKQEASLPNAMEVDEKPDTPREISVGSLETEKHMANHPEDVPAVEATEIDKPGDASVDVHMESAPIANVDLKALREQLTRQKAESKGRSTPPLASPKIDHSKLNGHVSDSNKITADLAMEIESAEAKGMIADALPDVKTIPTEPRKRELPTEPRSRVNSRTTSVATDISAPPRGPRADTERAPNRSSTPRIEASREPSPSTKLKNDESARLRAMPPPAAPKEMRDRVADRQNGQSRRELSPQRVPGSRSGSVDSRMSRASTSRREADRKRYPDDLERRRGEDDRSSFSAGNAKNPDNVSDTRRSERERIDRERDYDNVQRKRSRSDRDRKHEDDSKIRDRERPKDRHERDREREKERTLDRPRDRDRERARDGKDERDSRSIRERTDRKSDRDGRDRNRDHRERRERSRDTDRDRGSRIEPKDNGYGRRDRKDTRDRDREREKEGDRERSRPVGAGREREREHIRDRRKDADDDQKRQDDRSDRASRTSIHQDNDIDKPGPNVAHLDALNARYEDNRRRNTTSDPPSQQDRHEDRMEVERARTPETTKFLESKGQEDQSAAATPKLAERMGLVSRDSTTPRTDRGTQERGIHGEGEQNRRQSDRRSQRSDAPLSNNLHSRIDRELPLHSHMQPRQEKSPAISSPIPVRAAGPTISTDLDRSTSPYPKPSLSSRLGGIVDYHPSEISRQEDKRQSISMVGSVALESSRSPDRKRSLEELNPINRAGNDTPPPSSKRPKIDRAGARERGNALSRLSGGFLSKK